MQYRNRISRYISVCSVAASLILSSCINDNELCPSDNTVDDGVTIEFKVNTRDAVRYGSRAILPPTGTPQDGTVAENYLDLRNTVFMLFDDNQILIKLFIPQVTPDDESYATYSVRAFLSADEFQTLTGGKTKVQFSIAVAGNYSRLNPQNAAYHIGQTLDDIFNQTTVATFSMPISNNWMNKWIPSIYDIDYLEPTGEGSQVIGGMTPAYIPMAGIQTYNVSVDALAASTVDHPLDLSAIENGGDINLLRALAKIEIVDRIDAVGTGESTEQPDRYNRSWIEKAELVGHTNRGSLFPSLSQWNSPANPFETQYVTAPSVLSSYGYIGADPVGGSLTVTNKGATVNFFADAAATAAREDKCRVFTCYLTEYNPALLASTDPKMWIRITAQGPIPVGTEPNDNTSLPYRLEVAPYDNGNPGAPMAILRNNIYRYEVTGIKTDLELDLVVDDWTSHETEWEYSENPGMTDDGYLTWDVSPEISVNTENAEVVINNNVTLTGTFTFDVPKGGTWIASFVPEGATENDAFMFVDEVGNKSNTISGDIDGNTDEIKIVANFNPTTFDRRARLIFTVKTFDGRTISADVLDHAVYARHTYFTIIQNASL